MNEALTPAGYSTIGMTNLVAMTWARIEAIERDHYALLLETLERGRTPADDRALADLEHRRQVHLNRLMPADAHDEDPGERTAQDPPDAPDGDVDGDLDSSDPAGDPPPPADPEQGAHDQHGEGGEDKPEDTAT